MENLVRRVNTGQYVKRISVDDNVLYPTIVAVMNAIGARTADGNPYRAVRVAAVRLKNDPQSRSVWFPKLGGPNARLDDINKWNNYRPDAEHIVEECEEANQDWKKRAAEFENKRPKQYLVFGHVDNGYVFWGMYEMESYDHTSPRCRTVWKRIATEAATIPLP